MAQSFGLRHAVGYLGGYEVAVNQVPIPEPETWAMLLAGLGVVGAVTKRRRQE